MKIKKIITLLTDFGLQDPFVGIMKGVMLNINPKIHIVDITHNIRSYDVFEGALTLFQSYSFFPKGTIHIAVVDPGVGSDRKKLIIKTNSYFFIVPDNGIVSFIADREDVDVYEIYNEKYFLKHISNTFHGRDIFAPVGAFLSKGVNQKKIGRSINEFKRFYIPKIQINKKRGVATVIHIDKFGNIITNIDKSYIDNIECLYVKKRTIDKIKSFYEEGADGEIFAILGSTNYLEISINRENISEKMKIIKGDKIYFDLK